MIPPMPVSFVTVQRKPTSQPTAWLRGFDYETVVIAQDIPMAIRVHMNGRLQLPLGAAQNMTVPWSGRPAGRFGPG